MQLTNETTVSGIDQRIAAGRFNSCKTIGDIRNCMRPNERLVVRHYKYGSQLEIRSTRYNRDYLVQTAEYK